MKIKTTLISAAVCCACAGSAMAMTAADIKTEKQRIDTEYDAAKKQCDSLTGNAEEICNAQAKGNKKVAEATLEVHKNDTVKNRYDMRMAKAEADHEVAKEKCDDLAGNANDVCVKDAKAALTTAQADAKVDKKITNTVKGASADVNEAKKEAAADKRDANYTAAKERCDIYSGDAKDKCVADAKARSGK